MDQWLINYMAPVSLFCLGIGIGIRIERLRIEEEAKAENEDPKVLGDAIERITSLIK